MQEKMIIFDKAGNVAEEKTFSTEEMQTEQGLRPYECPRCHKDTFGYFEPFAAQHIDAWCSNCGYTFSRNKKLRAEYIRKHAVIEDGESEQ